MCISLAYDNVYLYIIYRATKTGLGEGGHAPPPIIFSDLNVRFFKLHIFKFSKPHSFSSCKLLTSTNIRFHSLRSVKN